MAYCRVLKAGNLVFVTGTAPVDPDGEVHAPGDGYAQAVRCLEIIRDHLGRVGVPLERVARTILRRSPHEAVVELPVPTVSDSGDPEKR